MRAAVITEPGGPEVLKVRELPDPVPGPDDMYSSTSRRRR